MSPFVRLAPFRMRAGRLEDASMATTEARPLESLDGPALLARLRAKGIRTKAVVDASGLSY